MTRYSKTMSEALEEVREASARADAKRAMSKDKDMKQDPFSKDDDASDDDVKAASKNIIMQLRKSVSMRGNHSVEFANGKQKVDAKIAQAVQDKFNKIKRPADKQKFQDKVAKSYKDLLMALKEQYEMVEEEVELDEGLFAKEYEDGQYRNGDENPFVDAIKKGGGKNIDVQKPTKRDPMLTIEFDGGDMKRIQKDVSKVGDGTEDLAEMKMNDPKLLKMFDKLKKGDKIKLKTSSTISQGKDFVEYIVKSKNLVNKGRVEKITLATVGNEKAVKKFLYKRDGTVGFAIGDMGASIDDIKEEVDLDEGRMKELHGYIEKGMSAQEIAKKMKLDVKTIKSLMDETELDEAKMKEEEGPDNRPDSAKEVDAGREDKKKTRIAQLQLQIAKATETINKLNAQEK